MSTIELSAPQAEVQLRFRRIDPEKDADLGLPAYHSDLAAGMDVEAGVESSLEVAPGEIVMVPTGFAVAIPPGYEIQVRPRSGLAIKHGVTIVNAPGTIDADYRGEIMVGLVNVGKKHYTIHRRDRIAQLILAPVSRASVTEVGELETTGRQDGGFGHTGK